MACKYIHEGVTYNSKEEFIAKVVQPKYGTLANVDQTLKAKGVSKEDAQKLTVPQNQFLHLLGRDNNWVTFFIKGILQDSAKKGYEKVLFPTGNTASKVEGHSTLEEFKKQKEDRIKELEETKTNNTLRPAPLEINFNEPQVNLSVDEEINQLKQELERVEREGFAALKPIYNFYENTVTNILNKTYGKENVKVITDEYGNQWREITINQARDLQDILPHEYAHHYIAWFRNTPIVQEAIKKWGSEEALVQSIGEQVVKQKGEAYNWWNNFVKWIMNQFNSLSNLQKEELTQILTDAFLTRQDLNNIGNNSFQQFQQSLNNPNTNPILQGNQEAVITTNDKIVWGHPAIGKTTMLKSKPDAFIDWDNEFNRKRDNWIASKSNTTIGTPEFKKARNKYMINYNNHKDYIAFVKKEWNKAKEKANKENKTLIASPHMLLNLFPNDFDKVITMSDKTFMNRAVNRSMGDEVNSKLWKEGINKTLQSVDKSKIIETDKFIGDLFDNTQQEQVKKFNELQERLSNKEFLEGAKNAFESSEELQNVYYEAAGFNKPLDFYEGDTLKIDDKTYTISEKISSKELAKRNGLTISSNVPVYIVNEPLGLRKGGYDTVNNIIILSKNSDKETIQHELIHSVEYNLDKKEIEPLYQKVKNTITEDSFNGFVSWNFKKSISEFIADALSKKVFRDALKKEGLLEEIDNTLSVYSQQLTPQQKQDALNAYTDFLARVSLGIIKNPSSGEYNYESKVKDIVYHGSNQKINQFEVRKEPLIHFGSENAALQRGDVLNQVVLNIKDLQTIKDGMWFLGTDEGGLLKELLDRNILTIEEVRSINEAKNKAIQESPYFHENYRRALPEGEKAGNKKLQEILKDRNIGFEYTNFSEDRGSTSYAVPSQEQIHILGSKQDIEGFKEFVKKASNPKVSQITDEYGNTWNEVEIIPEYTNPIELYNLKSESVGVKSQIPNKELVYDEIKAALIDVGFDVKSLEEASKITGKDYKNVNALVNFAVKMVALSNDANVIDIAEEAAHVAVAHGKLKNISLYNRAVELVKSTDEYREDYDRYKSRYTFEYGADVAEALALEEILGKIVRKHIIEGFDRSSDRSLIRVLKTLWEKFLSLFRKDSLNSIAQKYASDFINKKVKAENIEQSTEFYSLQKEGVTYKQLLDSLLKREKALTTKKGANVINIRRQIKSIREQIDDLTQLTGTIKFIGYLDQDTQTALSYLKSSFDIATTDEEVSNLQIRLRQLREKYAESPSDELKELIQSTRKNIRLLDKNKYKRITLRSDAAIPSLNHIHQYQELIQYYMPYLKDLKDVMLNQQESLGKRLGIPVSAVGARAIDKQIEKLTMIKEMIDVLTPKALEVNLAKDVSDIAGEKETGVDLSQEIAYGSNISSSIWYWFGSLRDSSDTLNRLVSTMMNNIYNLVRRKTLDKATEILTEFKDLIGKDTSWMYEVVDGKRTGRYIDNLLWTSHYEARKKFHKDLHTKYGFPEDSHQRNKLKREINGYTNIIKTIKRNSILSDEDKASIRRMELAMEKLRRYNDEVRTWYKENTVPRTNLTAIIDEARQKLSRNQFREWIDRNIEFNAKDEDVALEAVWNNDPNWYSYVSYYKYNFVQPSNGKIITVENFDGTTSKIKTVDWTNKNYNLLTDEQRNQLTRIKEIKKEIDVNLLNIPINDMPPQIYESTMDLLFRNDFPTIWKKLRGHLGSAFVTESDDIQFNPDLYQTDQSLSGYVPIRYTHKMEDPSRISTDALSSLIMYYNMATEYNEKSKNFAKFSVILEHVKNRKIITQDKKGNLVTEGSKSWNTRGLEQFLKVHLLGQGKDLLEYETPLGKVNVSKIVQNVSSWIRAKNLGLNFATMFSNFASSEAFLAIERIVGQYLNKESYTKSYGTLMSNLTDLMNNNANNKIAVLRRTFGLGRDLHTLFNDLDKNLFVRDQPSKFMFYGYEMGDFMTKSIAMLSVLYDYKLHNGAWYSSRELKAMKITDTDLVNMYDYLTVDKGKIGNDIDSKVIDRISNKIQYVANGIDGKITDVDRGAIYQHAIFSMVTIHRNWLFDGISKRFKAEGFNFRTLEYEKGYYRDFPSAFQVIGNFFYSDKRILSLHKAMLKYDSLQPWQKDNVKRLYTEMLMVAGFTVLAVLINQAAGDDDDDDAMDLLAYLSNRMLLEVSSFYNPTEITTAVTSPFVPMRDIELIMDFGKALDFSEIERGPWEGYSHSGKYFLQWIPGVKGINLIRDPQSANQFLKNKPLKPLYTIVE